MSDIKSLIKKAKPQAPSKFIVMGDPMTGKTTLAAKAPRPLFISFDGNAAKAGLDAIDVENLQQVREAVAFFEETDEYDTLVIDTIEGLADLFERSIIDSYNQENSTVITALTDVGYGKLTGIFNKRIANFSEALWAMPKNVIVLTYTKRRIDDLDGSIKLDSELKGIRHFTKFADAMILTSYDGERYRANVVSKRTVVAGKVDLGNISTFLKAAGWDLAVKKTKVGSTKK